MPIHHLARFCAGLAISGAVRASRQSRQQPTIIVQQTNTPPPGTGYLPGYQPFTNQPTSVVINPQPAVIQMENVKPNSYMVLAILGTLFCFFPFGIPAIVYASQVDSAYESGDYLRAHSSSSAARSWTIASFITGIILYSFFGLFLFIFVLNTSSDY